MALVSEIYNFRSIDDMLSTSGQPNESQLRSVAAGGYEVIINLALHDDPRYSLQDEMTLVEGLGLEYIHIPVQFDRPQEDDLLSFYQALEKYKHKKSWCIARMTAKTAS